MPMAAETMMMAAPKCASACTATLDLEVPHSSDASEAARVGGTSHSNRPQRETRPVQPSVRYARRHALNTCD
jgi:hypothetical protein